MDEIRPSVGEFSELEVSFDDRKAFLVECCQPICRRQFNRRALRGWWSDRLRLSVRLVSKIHGQHA